MKTSGPLVLAALLQVTSVAAQVPQMIGYQGRVTVGGTNFHGTAAFRFALVDVAGSPYWSNGVNAVSLSVSKGLYAVLIGDTSVPEMAALPASVFTNADVRLRVWFDDGVSGQQQLSPDPRIAAVGYALMAGNVPDGLITGSKLAAGAVTAGAIAPGSITGAQLASNLTVSGTVTADAFQGNGALPWQTATGVTQNASANAGYLLTNTEQSVVILPAAAQAGDVVRVSGAGAGGWLVAGNTNQSIVGATGPAGIVWTPRGSSRLWSALAASADGKKLVAAVYSGYLYVSSDAGATWTPCATNKPWTSVASSADGTRLVAGVEGGQLYTSTDSGATWTPRDSSRGGKRYVASSADGTKLVAVTSGDQLYTSTDAGTNWTARFSSANWYSVASSVDGTRLVAVAYGGYIFTSVSSGVDWSLRIGPANWYSVASSADGTRLAAVDYGGFIYLSSNGGTNWTLRGSARNWRSIASSADGTRLAAAAYSGDFVYLSTDAGTNWTSRASGQNWTGVALTADGTKSVAAVWSGQLHTSTAALTGPQGTSAAVQFLGNGVWLPMGEALVGAGAVGSAQLAADAVQSSNIAAGAVGTSQLADDSVTGAKIADGAVTANTVAPGAIGDQQLAPNLTLSGTVTADAFQGNGALPWQAATGVTQNAAANAGYLLTNDAQSVVILPGAARAGDVVRVSGAGAGGWLVAGNTNQSIAGATGPVGTVWTRRASNAPWYSVAASADGEKLAAAVYGGYLYVSSDSGATWTQCATNKPWTGVTSSADGTRLVAGAEGGQLYTSTDAGATWTPRDSNRGGKRYVASSADGTRLVAATSGDQLYTSTDAGTNWTARFGSGNWSSVASSADGTRLVAVVYGGYIFTSVNSGVDWTTRIGSGNWLSVASSADGTRLAAAINGGQIYTSTNGGTNWTARGSGHAWRSVASSADGTRLAGAAYGEYVYTSVDSGETWTRVGPGGWYNGIASSADGTRLVACELGGFIHTSPAALTGPQGTSAAVQFLGNGVWQPMGEALVGAGAVGSAQLAVGAVLATNIAAGAVGTAQLADGSVTGAKIADGTITDADINGTTGISGSKVIGGDVSAERLKVGTGHTLSGLGATIAGGAGNTASGFLAAVPGGDANVASGTNSLAAGHRAKALHNGAFVWGDSTDTNISSTAANQFIVRAEGGIYINDADIHFRTVGDNLHGLGFYGGSKRLAGVDLNGPALYGNGGGALGTVPNTATTNIALQWSQNNTVTINSNLTVNGNAYKPGGGSWSSTSDARLKKNIQPLAGALDTLLSLRGVTFEYIDPAAVHEPAGPRIGMIAQEVEQVVPDWVSTGDDGYKRLTYRGFEALAVEALRETQRQLQEKEARIADLEKRVEELERLSRKGGEQP